MIGWSPEKESVITEWAIALMHGRNEDADGSTGWTNLLHSQTRRSRWRWDENEAKPCENTEFYPITGGL